MRYKSYIISWLLCIPMALSAQQTGLLPREVSMGQVEWYGEGRTTLELKNTSQEAIKITNVLTSTSLMKAQWPRDAISTGGTAEIVLTYRADLLGRFEKAVRVFTSLSNEPIEVKITGDVVTEKDDYSGDFPYRVGDIWLSTDNLEFDDVSRGDRPLQVISVKNGGKTLYHPELMHLPKYLSSWAEPDKLLPGRTGKLYVMLNSDMMEDYGLKQERVYLSRFPGDKVGADNEVDISSVILPPFDTTSVIQSALAPMLEMDRTELDLPPLKGKSKVSGSLILKNVGKSSLEIRSLQVFHPAVNVRLGQMKIAPGRSQKLHISVLSKYMKQSRSRLRVLMITNDPKHSKMIIDVRMGKEK
ncbi:MAG: DUF1573 domain-containing protein [Bacteroidaceae bacterium]|nr:DUF1573 domain-containing protein [Bacteroidaceae bacterium]